MTVTTAWHARIERDALTRDPEQAKVVAALQSLSECIREAERLWPRLRRRLRLPPAGDPRGLYLWGGVGRGKTFLLDLFYESLEIQAKRRVHFHRMMSEVHSRLRQLSHVADPLDQVAADMAEQIRVLCFDEFFVSDIGDAMILGRLLKGLIGRHVVLVATSNVHPSELYRNGLQRERFQPAIELLQKHTRIVELGGGTDYRLRLLQSAGTYLCPPDERAAQKLSRYFAEVAGGADETDLEIHLAGRPIPVVKRAAGIAWFDFRDLCEGPRSQKDYIEIARSYPTVIVTDVPVMTSGDDDAARRFISLVDEFYDRRVKLLVSAAAKVERLYSGQRLAFEFERTASRLTEMQSTDYLHAPHLS